MLCRVLEVEPHEEEGPGFIERMFSVGGSFVQTLEASGDGVIQRFLDTRGPGLHHVAFEVDGIDAALEYLRGEGVRLVDEEARAGGMGTRIAFVHPSAFGGMLVELVEPASAEPSG
jgi:methylmalonyl-CoA/ethylmalonyl-CoA epimerase